MSIRVIALIHPFSTLEKIEKEVAVQSVRCIYESLQTGLPIDHCRCQVDGEIITDFDYIPRDGATVWLRVVPSGTGNQMRDNGIGMKVAGGAMILVGVLLSIFSYGTLASVGVGLIGSGVSMLLGGIVMYNIDIPLEGTADNSPQTRPGLKGSRNTARHYGYVPVLFGKHLVVPDYAASPYITISNNQQYLTQLFCAGYNNMVLDITSFKLGDTPLIELSGTKDIQKILSGQDDIIKLELLSDGNMGSLYTKYVSPIDINLQVQQTLSDGSSGAVIRTTPNNTLKVDINFSFPQGLFGISDNGSMMKIGVYVKLFVKPKDSPDSSYTALGYITGNDGIVSGQTKDALYYSVSAVLPYAGSWTIKIENGGPAPVATGQPVLPGTGIPHTKTKYDSFYALSMNAYRDDEPVDVSIRNKLYLLAIRLRATDRINNVIDNFNFVATAKHLAYKGTGSGPSAWKEAETKNPASAMLFTLLGQVNRKPVDIKYIDWKAFEQFYMWCETHSYSCSVIMSDKMTLMDLLKQIALTARAVPTKKDGLFSLIQDISRDAPTQMLTPKNTIDYSETIAFADIPKALEMQFVSEKAGWKNDVRYVYNTSSGDQEETDPSEKQEVNLWGVTDEVQAFLIGRYDYACSLLRPRQHTITVDFEYLMAQKGEWIKYSGDMALRGIAWGRIKALITENGTTTGFFLDEYFEMEEGKSYQFRVRTSDNKQTLYYLVTQPGFLNVVTLTTPISLQITPKIGDLFVLGESGSMEVDLIIMDIEPINDGTAKLTCVDYSPEIFGIDDPGYVIPEWDPHVSVGGSIDSGVSNSPPPEYLIEVNKEIQDITSYLFESTHIYVNNIPPEKNITDLSINSNENPNGTVDVTFEWKYEQGTDSPADGFLIYLKRELSTPDSINLYADPCNFIPAATSTTSYKTIANLPARQKGTASLPLHYRFGVVAVGSRKSGTIPHADGVVENPEWLDVTFASIIEPAQDIYWDQISGDFRSKGLFWIGDENNFFGYVPSGITHPVLGKGPVSVFKGLEITLTDSELISYFDNIEFAQVEDRMEWRDKTTKEVKAVMDGQVSLQKYVEQFEDTISMPNAMTRYTCFEYEEKLYFPQYNGNKLEIFDLSSKTFQTVTMPSSMGRYTCFVYDGKAYFPQNKETKLEVLDLSSMVFETIDLPNNSFRSTYVIHGGKAYLPCSGGPYLEIIDLSSRMIQTVTMPSNMARETCFEYKGKIYFPEYGGTKLEVFDVFSMTFQTVTMPNNMGRYTCFVYDGKAYFPQTNGTKLEVLNLTAMTFQTITMPNTMNRSTSFVYEGYGYFPDNGGAKLEILNLSSMSIQTITMPNTMTRYTCLVHDRHAYFPEGGGSKLEIYTIDEITQDRFNIGAGFHGRGEDAKGAYYRLFDGTKLYVANGSITNLQGPPGPKGEKGDQGVQGLPGADGEDGAAATIEIGTVTPGDSPEDAEVINIGTNTAAVFDFILPKGDPGQIVPDITQLSSLTILAETEDLLYVYDHSAQALKKADSSIFFDIIQRMVTEQVLKKSAPLGTIIYRMDKSYFDGYLYCNGSIYLAELYPDFYSLWLNSPMGDPSSSGYCGTDPLSGYPRLPDLRGVVLRAVDDGKGLDGANASNEYQYDAIRNITGYIYDYYNTYQASVGGVFKRVGSDNRGGSGASSGYGHIELDLSSQVPTSTDNRMKSRAVYPFIKVL